MQDILSTQLTRFDDFNPQEQADKLIVLLEESLQKIDQLVCEKPELSVFLERYEAISQKISVQFSPFSHLQMVCSTDEIRDQYQRLLPELSRYQTSIGQHKALFNLVESYHHRCQEASAEQKRLLELDYLGFKLRGVACTPEDAKQVASLFETLSAQQNQFHVQLMDSTDAWTFHTTDKSVVSDLPSYALSAAKQLAQSLNKTGYVFNLSIPSYQPLVTYCSDRSVREQAYRAFSTRASELFPVSNQWDNASIMTNILTCRQELATILGYDHYAAYSLVTKMAKSAEEVEAFLLDLHHKLKPKAEAEWQALCQFAHDKFNLDTLESWDVAFVTEHFKQAHLNMDDESYRPYFQLKLVLPALFKLAKQLFNVTIKPYDTPVSTWHPDVTFYGVYDDQNQLIGGFYCDLFARKRKQQGAWVSSAQSRFQTSQHLDLPIIHLVCNFTPCEPNSTALINHQELVTLYHEFGHCLHCVLTETHYPSVSGTSGVPWDAVELPSQLMENWVWDADFLKTFARHRQTNQPIPDDMLTTLCQSRSFLSGLATLRQLEFAVFDIRLHRDFSPKKGSDQIQACIDQTRKDVAIVTPPSYNRFPNTFSHIFSGSGYAAGYYSYKWAEVLSSDAFSVFEQHGILDQATGLAFKNAILSKGGSVDPKIAYEQFKGGPASSDALIRQLLGKSISDTVVTG